MDPSHCQELALGDASGQRRARLNDVGSSDSKRKWVTCRDDVAVPHWDPVGPTHCLDVEWSLVHLEWTPTEEGSTGRSPLAAGSEQVDQNSGLEIPPEAFRLVLERLGSPG
ncbi:hypothetical protein FOZ63_001428 [Perkinsus olseni]|uniref:Uncharacterized protein n=1 Tax=Perkinsus olseni TaxID=32597 RepID=A0A7J6QLW5_PEROL|nr:hypothetical protein FOZ63_001428 [Perkinsus olseni]